MLFTNYRVRNSKVFWFLRSRLYFYNILPSPTIYCALLQFYYCTAPNLFIMHAPSLNRAPHRTNFMAPRHRASTTAPEVLISSSEARHRTTAPVRNAVPIPKLFCVPIFKNSIRKKYRQTYYLISTIYARPCAMYRSRDEIFCNEPIDATRDAHLHYILQRN